MPFVFKNLFKKRVDDGSTFPEWLVVGIGNPGGRYKGTRHNVGWQVAERLVKHATVLRVKRQPKVDADLTHLLLNDVRIVVAKPTAYVNNSGAAVAKLLRYYNLKPPSLMVLCDDIHLPPGRVRLRAEGGAGGHNGLKSIINALGVNTFNRIRVGIGEPPTPAKQTDYVLSRPHPNQRQALNEAVANACRAVQSIVSDGVAEAMNIYNTNNPES